MKTALKKILIILLSPINSKLGYVLKENSSKFNNQLSLTNKINLLGNFYNILKEIGFKPKHIVDVGANRGSWTREALKYFPDCYYTLVEPQRWMRDEIKDLLGSNKKITFHAVGAGEVSGRSKLTIHERDDSCTFRMTESEAYQRGFKQIDVPVVTLNEIISGSDTSPPDIIKIDAEGLDIEVLKGASNFFGITEVFLVESGVMNKSFSNDAKSVINFMDMKGYRLFDITDLNRPWETKVLWLLELVFIKKGGFIDSKSFI